MSVVKTGGLEVDLCIHRRAVRNSCTQFRRGDADRRSSSSYAYRSASGPAIPSGWVGAARIRRFEPKAPSTPRTPDSRMRRIWPGESCRWLDGRHLCPSRCRRRAQPISGSWARPSTVTCSGPSCARATTVGSMRVFLPTRCWRSSSSVCVPRRIRTLPCDS